MKNRGTARVKSPYQPATSVSRIAVICLLLCMAFTGGSPKAASNRLAAASIAIATALA